MSRSKGCHRDAEPLILKIAVYAVIGSVVTLFLMVMLVSPPTFLLPKFKIVYAHAYGFNTSSSHSTFLLDIGLLAVNPNDKTILSYGEMKGSALYRIKVLSDTRLAPFTQDRGEENEKMITVKLNATDIDLNGVSMDDISRELNRVGKQNISLSLSGLIQFTTCSCTMQMIKVSCENITVGFSSELRSGVGSLVECDTIVVSGSEL